MSSDNILVAIKSRPFISREKSEKLRPQWSVQDKAIFQIDEDGHRLGEPYSFDHIFTENATNVAVYTAVVEPLVKSFLNGFNSTIFAYGQTSSGKTHTMMGTGNTPGIIQLAISDVFQHVSRNAQRRYLISCSYFEIYNEKINDLLDKNGKDLKIREDFCGSTFVNAKEEVVNQQDQVFELMKIGSKIRKIGCTNMNERSSRSHTIFRFTIKSTENNVEHGPVQISHLNLVDLAGSERIAHTKAEGVRLKEGVNINKSLLALGNVIRQLSDGEGYINYRDSNLTRLLQHALGGNAKSLIIATITIAAGEETKSTLEFAQRAKVVKNKPIINEISEQVKLKQYELATAGYKERLEKETRRIKEMEREKEEREKEIAKLKQQVKLIDLFTNGPETKKVDSKIPRRHTMGHYIRTPLQTIPESRVLHSNIMPEKDTDNSIKCDEDDDELLFKSISQVSDYDYIKMALEESINEGILATTPEPPEELQSLDESTPVSYLRKRLKYFEESYLSLQEFTKLEAECKEDGNVLCELRKEKENLLKDVIDLSTIIKETRQEQENMKLNLKEEISILKNDLDFHKKKSTDLAFALEQAESEKDALRLAKEQLLNDGEFLLEQQKLKYEKQIEYFLNEIERLNKKEDEINKTVNNFEEVNKPTKDNENFQLNIEKMTICEDKILELEEKLGVFKKKKEEDCDVLSVSTQTEDIDDVTPKGKDDIHTELIDITNETMIIKKECDELKENMFKMNDELERLQGINAELEEELRRWKLRGASVIDMGNIVYLEKDVIDKKEEINKLLAKIAKIENENKSHENIVESQKEEIRLKNEKISQLLNEVDDFRKSLQSNDDRLNSLAGEFEMVKEETRCQIEKFDLQVDEINSKNEIIADLNNKVEKLEQLLQEAQKKLLDYSEQIHAKDGTISDLRIKLEHLEKVHQDCYEEISACKLEMDSKSVKLKSQEEKIIETEADKQRYINELESNATKIYEQEQAINDLKREMDIKLKELQDEILRSDKEKNSYEQEAEIFRKEVICKEDEIRELTDKVEALQAEITINIADLISNEKQLFTLENAVEKLEKDNEKYRDEIDTLKEELESKEKTLISSLQLQVEPYQNEVQDKENIISELKTEIKDLEKWNTHNKIEIEAKNREISELTQKMKHLENCNNKMEEDIQTKYINTEELNGKIRELQDCIRNNTETIQAREKTILELSKKIKYMEKKLYDSEDKVQSKNEEISQLTSALNDLKGSIQNHEDIMKTKDHQISEVAAKITQLETDKAKIEKDIQTKNTQISQLEATIKEMEMVSSFKDDQIVNLSNAIQDLNSDIILFKNENKVKTDEISELQLRVQKLDDDCHNYESEVSQCREEIYLQERKIRELMESGGGKDLKNKKTEDYEKEDIVQELKRTIAYLSSEKEEFDRILDNISIENEKEKVGFRTKIFNLENVITELKMSRIKRPERLPPARYSSSSPNPTVSPKEARRRKRQSIHDERRGIDLTARAVDFESYDEELAAAFIATGIQDGGYKGKIQRLQSTVEHLFQENENLETEIKGFMGELSDQKRYNAEKDTEIEMLTDQIRKLKQGMGQEDCKECPQKQTYIKKLEDLQKSNKYKIVELQTKYYDLQNRMKEEMTNFEERERALNYCIAKLEKKLGETVQPEIKHAEVQCDVMDYQQLLEKYGKVKKLARMRREEANILRARLGIDSDEQLA